MRKTQLKTEVLVTRCTPSEKRQLRKLGKKMYLTDSSVVRRAIRELANREK